MRRNVSDPKQRSRQLLAMGQIQSSIGLITGVPILDTVDQLISVSAKPRDNLIGRTNLLQSEQLAIGELTASVISLQLAATNLGKESTYTQKTVSSSNTSLLTATVSGSPTKGTYQFTPLQTAQTQQFLSTGFANIDQPIGEGSISIQRAGFLDDSLGLTRLNGGEGVARGKIRITDRSGESAEIDLRFAVNIDDVLKAINEADGIDVTAVADGDAIKLSDESGQSTSNLRVSEVNGGSTAADLGLANIDVAADEAVGEDVLSLYDDVLLSELNDGNGISLRQGVEDLTVTFRDNSTSLNIDLSDLASAENRDSATLGDLVDAINAADPTRLQAAISADGDSIELTDLTTDGGGTFAVSSAYGGTVAEELGLTSTAADDTVTGRRLQAGLKDTLLTSLNGGSGLTTLGNLDLQDRDGNTATVDLSGEETLGGVIDAINAAGIDIIAELNAAGNGIRLRDTSGGTGNLIVANGDGTNTADTLQLTVDAAQKSIDSGSLNRQIVSRQTKLADYNGGVGVEDGKFTITDSQGTAAVIDVDSETVTTIGDVLDLINAAGIGVTASINAAGDGIQLTDTAGGAESLTVEDVDDNTAANLLIAGEAEAGEIDGSTTTVIEISDEDTLEDLITKLNDSGLGLSASIFNEGGGSKPFRISIVGQESGLDGRLLIDTSDGGFTLDEIVSAQDARLLFGSIEQGGVVTSSSDNNFSDIPDGVNLTIKGTSTDPVSITVGTTNTSFVSAVKSLVNSFNALRTKIDTHTFFNQSDSTTGILFGSNETLRIESQIGRLFSDRHFGLGDVQSLEQLGISFKDDGKLELNESKLTAAYASDPSGVETFFTDEERGFKTKLDAAVESLAGADNSLLINRTISLNSKIELHQERIASWNERLDRQRELLLNQFFAMESIIGNLQNSLEAVQQIAALPPLTSSGG